MRHRVVILGNLPLATKIIKLIQSKNDIELAGVVPNGIIRRYPDTDNEVCAAEYCTKNNIKKLDFKDIYKLRNLTLCVSARNSTILQEKFLRLFKKGIVNCHGGYLPDYKGVGGHIFPILNKENFSGATIHWMNKKVDTGNVIARSKILILKNDNGLSLFKKINDELYELIKKYLDELLNQRILGLDQDTFQFENRSKKSYRYFQKDIKNLYTNNKSSALLSKALAWDEIDKL